MPVTPEVGSPGGQVYDVASAIRTFLEQMAGGGGISFGAAVVKELIQNADDAGATELVLTLDERSLRDLPPECSGYGHLLNPALIVRNDACFRIAGEVADGEHDDFTAICKVAEGHKRFNPTAAGRFGIGFNSVYFLTDTPLLFSRREVHIFDLRNLMFNANGWRFSLDDFPAGKSNAGPIKTVLDLALPKAVLGEGVFQELANSGRDYRQTVFRLPLRQTTGTGLMDERGPVFPSASFPRRTDRNDLLRQMCEEARRSLLFLKSLRRVVLGALVEGHFEEWARIQVSREPSQRLEEFVKTVRGMRDDSPQTKPVECSFRCDIALEANSGRIGIASGSASFLVTHAAGFEHQDLRSFAEKLRKNGERAVPWVAIAVPLDARSFDWEGTANAGWRVFLPLVEEGPCACILNAALFVDPSRRAAEFRTDGSDETLRKSQWNRMLVEQCLVPRLREASAQVIDHARDLVEQEPKKYLSLFPTTANDSREPACLSDVVRDEFHKGLWLLKLYDLWGDPFDIGVGLDGQEMQLEKVPEWLSRYGSAFEHLTTESRKFVVWKVGDALRDCLGDRANVDVRTPGSDVADHVLLSGEAPKSADLTRLLKLLGGESLTPSAVHGRWAFKRDGTEELLLRFDPDILYLARTGETPPVYEALSAIGISFERAEWVARDAGLCTLRSVLAEDLDNLRTADDAGALELLRRVGKGSHHDLVSDHRRIAPIVDFLCDQSPHRLTEDLQLAFLVKTAAGKLERRGLGVVFLRPEAPTPDEEDLWKGLLREAFAEVDPQFARQLRRAVQHAPLLLTCFGDPTCEVKLARGDLLDVLHNARLHDERFIGRLAERLNHSGDGKDECRPEVYRAARLLLREADRCWDTLDEPVRITALALPIHRTASGRMVSLSSEGECATAQVTDRYFLQSADDLRDAPLELPTGTLLHGLDSEIRSFYRRRLEIREQGRVEVLKECLRQIGADATRSGGVLRYVAKHYGDTIEHLRDRGSEVADDLKELVELHRAAQGVPCLDGTWHRATECVETTDLFGLLERQGWEKDRVPDLVSQLTYPRRVAEPWSENGKLAQNLWSVETLDRDLLAELAIKSESPDLPFRDRTKVIYHNLRLVPQVAPRRAIRVDKEVCLAVAGPVEFASLVLVDINEIGVSDEVVRATLPKAADLPSIARLIGGDVPAAAAVLRALGVPTVDSASMLASLIGDFAGIWSKLGSDARIDLLSWLGRQKTVLPPEAVSLDTILVGEKKGEWVRPDNIIAPRWASLAPPNLSAARIPHTHRMPKEVLRLWDEWCGIRDLDAVVESVVRATCNLPRDTWPSASEHFADWLDRLVEQHGEQAVAGALRNRAWLLSGRGVDLEFHQPADVLDHPGAEVLQNKFWVMRCKMPDSLSGKVPTRRLAGTREILELVVQCLASAARAHPKAAESVYELLVELVSDEPAAEAWRCLASSQPVFRLFRKLDEVVSAEELFLGEQDQNEDFGQVLYCFGARDDPKKRIRELYRKLGVAVRPTAKQIANALTGLSGQARAVEKVHSRLVNALTEVTAEEECLEVDELRRITVCSCAKTYEPLARCYRDPELDRPSRVSAECRDRIIDGRGPANRKLIRWIDEHFPDTVLDLRDKAPAELAREPDEVVQRSSANILDAWRDWLEESASAGSVVWNEMQKLGFAVNSEPVRIEVVSKIHVRFRLPDDFEVVPSDEWDGPELFHDSRDRLLVRRDLVEPNLVGQASDVDRLDELITDTLEDLLRKRTSPEGVRLSPTGSLREAVRSTLERPGALETISEPTIVQFRTW